MFDDLREFLSEETQRQLLIEPGRYAEASSLLSSIESRLDHKFMDSLTEEERERQKRNLAACARLTDWMESNGAVLNKVKVHYFERHYRGIVAERETDVNESLLFIPRKLLITYEDSRMSGLVKKIDELGIIKLLKSTSHTPLSVFLLEEQEKGEASFYQPYLATFPEQVEGLPIEFTDEEIGLLECSPIRETIAKRKSNIRHDYDVLVNQLPGFDRFSFEDFKHYRNLIGSRVFGLEIDGHKTGAMVPFAGIDPSP